MKTLILSDEPVLCISYGRSEIGSVVIYSGNYQGCNIDVESNGVGECHVLLSGEPDKFWLSQACELLADRGIFVFVTACQEIIDGLHEILSEHIIPVVYNGQMQSYGYNLICELNNEQY